MSTYYIAHFGILGQKWGVQNGPPYPLDAEDHSASEKKAARTRTKYRSTGIRSYIAKKKNEKIKKSFDDWKVKAARRENAIELGKKANEARLAYERSDKDKDLKKAYKTANKDYKKALRSNTSWHQGQIRREVGSNLASGHLSEAKKVEKQLKADPNNKELQKKYSKLMSRHDVELASSRRAESVGRARSYRKAAAKRALTMTVKGAAVTAAAVGGAAVLNKVVGGGNIRDIRPEDLKRAARTAREFGRYIYV